MTRVSNSSCRQRSSSSCRLTFEATLVKGVDRIAYSLAREAQPRCDPRRRQALAAEAQDLGAPAGEVTLGADGVVEGVLFLGAELADKEGRLHQRQPGPEPDVCD